jgi:hypothetical protein
LGKSSDNHPNQGNTPASGHVDHPTSTPTSTPNKDDIVKINIDGLDWHFISLEIAEDSYEYSAEITNNTSQTISSFSYTIMSGTNELGGGRSNERILPGEKQTFGGGTSGISIPMDPEKINIVVIAQFE